MKNGTHGVKPRALYTLGHIDDVITTGVSLAANLFICLFQYLANARKLFMKTEITSVFLSMVHLLFVKIKRVNTCINKKSTVC